MKYQSKTYSLSEWLVERIEAARSRGETPNQFLTRAVNLIRQDDTDDGEDGPRTYHGTPIDTPIANPVRIPLARDDRKPLLKPSQK